MDITKSKTALNGYKEEQLVCDDINKRIKNKLRTFVDKDDLHTGIIINKQNRKDLSNGKIKIKVKTYKYINKFKRTHNTSKIDITNGKINIQVKKCKKQQIGQINRGKIEDIIKHIPELNTIKKYLKGLCELPLLECGKLVDKSKERKKLNENNYSKDELKFFISVLNKNKRKIVKYALQKMKNEPKYLCGVEYNNNKRKKIIFYKINDVIDYICKNEFKIKKKETVVKLGDAFTFQRKGGDGGKKTSNDLQFKLIFCNLKIKEKILQNL
jgi:hypothetical protein